MAIRSGFYNGADRPYYTTEFSKLFNLLINDGVIMHYGGRLLVSENTGMKVEVNTGYAWFHSTWTDNNSVLVLPIGASAPQTSRIDAVVIKIDTRNEGRVNDIIVIQGTPNVTPVKPSMVTGIEGVYYVPLAYITIKPLAQEITPADIENMVGTDVTPFVTGILDTLSISDLLTQYEADLANWFTDADTQLNAVINAADGDFNTWFENLKTTKAAEYNTWYTNFKTAAETWYNSFHGDMESWRTTFVAFMNNWKTTFIDEMETWRTTFTKQNTDWTDAFTADMENFRTVEQNAWDTWFATIQSNLSGDIAGNLQAQISAVAQDVSDLEAQKVVYYNKTLVAANWLKIAEDEYSITLALGTTNLSKFIPDVIFEGDPILESTLTLKTNNTSSVTFTTSVRPTINLVISTITLIEDTSTNPAVGRYGTHNIIPPATDLSGVNQDIASTKQDIVNVKQDISDLETTVNTTITTKLNQLETDLTDKIDALGYRTIFPTATVGAAVSDTSVTGYSNRATITPSVSLANAKGISIYFTDATVLKYTDLFVRNTNGVLDIIFNNPDASAHTITIDYIEASVPIE